MSDFEYKFEQLVDLAQVTRLLESHHELSGMTYALLDPAENCLVAVGWQDICVRFHRVHPVSCARCQESDAYIKEHLQDFSGDILEYRCKNGMIDVAMPICIEGRHLATFFTGQFFYDDFSPDIGFFIQQAEDIGFDRDAYLDALERVPVFSREHVRDNMLFLRNMVNVLSRCGLNNLKLNREMEARRRAEGLLYWRERDYRAMLENAPDPVSRYDRDARRIWVNPAFEKVLGKSSCLLLGTTPSEMPAGGQAGVGRQTEQAIRRVLAEGVPVEVEATWQDAAGAEHCYQIRFVPEFGAGGVVNTVLGIARDIGLIRAYQQQLHTLAYYDPLTGLPNRELFHDRLQQAVADTATFSLMMLDLDRFKTVNDSLGHAVGDELLKQVGQRLGQQVGDGDTVARLGGDEFAIILQGDVQETALAPLANKILSALAEPFAIQDRLLSVTASIGIATYPKDSRKVAELVQLADTAMYHAKAQGKNHFQYCSAELRSRAKERLAIEVALRNGLRRHEFEVYYQPKIAMKSGKLVGAEALLRWQQPEWGAVAPDRFIPIAEDTGLIFELGKWVLREACLTARNWNRGGKAQLTVAVNLSARQFDNHHLVDTIRTILADTGCRAEWLELEITESLLLESRDDILGMLEELGDMGFSLAIDDFGTGYSALAYLAKFPIHTLKIDKSFVRDVTTNRCSAELIKAITSLAFALRMELVAEGVETVEQAVHLHDLGCHFAQGYLYGKPVPQEQFEKMMGAWVADEKYRFEAVFAQGS